MNTNRARNPPSRRVKLVNRLHILACVGTLLTCGLSAQAVEMTNKLTQQITTCLACHGVEGLKVDQAFTVPKIDGQQSDYLLAALKEYRSGGARKSVFMGAQVATLSEMDMQALAEYFADATEENPLSDARQPTGERQFPRGAQSLGGASEAGSPHAPPETRPAKWMVSCVACHGGIGSGNMPDYPILTSQYQDYLLHALSDYRSGKRKHPFMPIYAKTLNETEMQEITQYLANQRVVLKVGVAPLQRSINSIKMIDIPAGEYEMGTNETKDPNLGRPEHKVAIASFRMGVYAVTFDQYDAFAIDTHRTLPSDSGWGRGTRPVINVTLEDTLDFIKWLNQKSGKNYRLPSEAEREYATRAGSSTNFWWGDTLDSEMINGLGVKGRDQWKYTAPVGQFPVNGFGLYDVTGNVWERTADCWHSDYVGAPTDASAWVEATCHDRVIRGSYWGVPRVGHFTRYRAIAADAYRGSGLGFRVAEDR